MASLFGGQFRFQDGATDVNLGLTKTGASAPKPGSVSGALNIEVFTGITTGVLPDLKSGFDAGVIVSDTVSGDSAPHLIGSFPDERLTGRRLTLFGGAYQVTDTVTGNSSQTRSWIHGGFGKQTIVGAVHDTVIGGSGTQRLDGSSGTESVLGGTRNYTILGGVGDTISGSNNATSLTAGDIKAGAGSMSIRLGHRGSFTVAAGASDTILSGNGSANATITGARSSRITLTQNTGQMSVVSAGKNVIIAGNGNETIKGSTGDRIGVGNGNTVGGALLFNHLGSASGAIAFGTNDSVNSTTYDTVTTGVASRGNDPGSSFANVTVTNFKVGTDSIFYKNETSTLNNDIVVTSRQFNGNTTFTLPDGTVMTLIGVNHITTSFFK